MPELPEVETTRRGVAALIRGSRLTAVTVREPRLRWPVAREVVTCAHGQTIVDVERRGKYLLFRLEDDNRLMLHLGMSGSLRVVPVGMPPGGHDHVDLCLDSGKCVRLNDPRRFGSLFLVKPPPDAHPLLRALGPEPLGEHFHGHYLHRLSRGRRVSVKSFIMNGRVVVGVGNIYAGEALHRAGIHPARMAGRIAAIRYQRLAAAIRGVLSEAIAAGGTTLRDFASVSGTPGYFRQRLDAYGRAGQPCRRCGTTLRARRIAQRSTVFCPYCQR